MDPNSLIYINTGTYLSYFNTESKEDSRKCLLMMYETLTTLSTNGLGDYFPKADEERLLTAVLFLSGTSLFSFIMGSFLEIV
jgi:Ion channel